MLRKRLSGIWGTAWTGLSSAVVLGTQLFKEDEASIQRQSRLWAKGLLMAWGVEVKIVFEDDFPMQEKMVIISNHQSHIDVVALMHALPRTPGFVAKKELADIPFFGSALRTAGHVVVDRKRSMEAQQAIDQAAAKIQPGTPVVVFAEGTRRDSKMVGPFKKGGFHLAKNSGACIVPVGIRGSADRLPKHQSQVEAGLIEIFVGRALDNAMVSDLPMEVLIEKVRAEIVRLAGMPPEEKLGQ